MFVCLCLYVVFWCPIITHEPLDCLALNFNLGNSVGLRECSELKNLNQAKGEGQIYKTLMLRLCELVAPPVFTLSTSMRRAMRVFYTNLSFQIPISLQPDGVNLRYFKPRLFDPTDFMDWKSKDFDIGLQKLMGKKLSKTLN